MTFPSLELDVRMITGLELLLDRLSFFKGLSYTEFLNDSCSVVSYEDYLVCINEHRKTYDAIKTLHDYMILLLYSSLD